MRVMQRPAVTWRRSNGEEEAIENSESRGSIEGMDQSIPSNGSHWVYVWLLMLVYTRVYVWLLMVVYTRQ